MRQSGILCLYYNKMQFLHVTNELIGKSGFESIFKIVNSPVFKTLTEALNVPDFQMAIKTAQRLNQYYLRLKVKVY